MSGQIKTNRDLQLASKSYSDLTGYDDAVAFTVSSFSYGVFISGGADISLTRDVDDITGGTLNLYCRWWPLSSDGNVVAA